MIENARSANMVEVKVYAIRQAITLITQHAEISRIGGRRLPCQLKKRYGPDVRDEQDLLVIRGDMWVKIPNHPQ
jgi:hypothetical protein